MDISTLKKLLSEGETLTVEFKSQVAVKELAKIAVGLANTQGRDLTKERYLVIGVSDQGIPQVQEEAYEGNPEHIPAVIVSRTEPPVEATVEVLQFEGAELIVVEVMEGLGVVSTKTGIFLHRILDAHGNPQCVAMSPHQVVSRAGSIGQLDYSRAPVPGATMDDLSEAELDRFRELTTQGGDKTLTNFANQDLLKALNLVTRNDELTVGALLLFGKEETLSRYLPAHEVGFQELENLAVRSSYRNRAPLLRAMMELSDRVMARNPEEEIEIGLVRIPLPHYSKIAVRELLANALTHRDYTQLEPTLVQIKGDTLSVSNPGGFPRGTTLLNLLETMPRPRNPALAEAFKRTGLVERTGRGIDRAFASQLALGRPAPDYSGSNDDMVVAKMRAGTADKNLARFIATARQEGNLFSLQELQALHEVRREGGITPARAAKLFGVDVPTALALLGRLAEEGILVARVDPIQQEEMVLNFVREHGAITRSRAADMFRITPAQATYLLRRLRKKGKLRMEGSYKGARYVAGDLTNRRGPDGQPPMASREEAR